MPANGGDQESAQKDKIWQDTFSTVLYDVWLEERVDAWLLQFWTRVNTVCSLVTTVTATGSAVAVWPLWGQSGYRTAWGILVACAAISSIFITVFGVPEKVKNLSDYHTKFLRLRLRVRDFWNDIDSMPVAEARKRFQELRDEGNDLISSAPTDIALTKKTRERIQAEFDRILKTEGYVE